MRTTAWPERITVAKVEPGAEVLAYRIVRSDNKDDPVFLNSLRSNYELMEEPRKVERSWAAIHMGISVYLTPERAFETARAWPKLGDFVAELGLRSGLGFNYAMTGHRGHLTLWADPIKLRSVTVDVEAVSR